MVANGDMLDLKRMIRKYFQCQRRIEELNHLNVSSAEERAKIRKERKALKKRRNRLKKSICKVDPKWKWDPSKQ